MTRNQYLDAFKAQVVKEVTETGNAAAVARRFELHANLVRRWVNQAKDGKFDNVDLSATTPLEAKALSQENEQLKKLLGEKDLEISILRDLIKKKNPHLLKKLK